jgi:hypothetical protein
LKNDVILKQITQIQLTLVVLPPAGRFFEKRCYLQKNNPNSADFWGTPGAAPWARNYPGIILELSWNYSRGGDRAPELKVPFRLHQTPLWGLKLSRNYPGIISELSWNYSRRGGVRTASRNHPSTRTGDQDDVSSTSKLPQTNTLAN